MKMFLIFSLQLILIVFSGTVFAEDTGKDPAPAPDSTPTPAAISDSLNCIVEGKPLNTTIKCTCLITQEKEGIPDSWIKDVEGTGEDILPAINNAIGACNNFKKENISIKKAKLAHCSEIHMDQD